MSEKRLQTLLSELRVSTKKLCNQSMFCMRKQLLHKACMNTILFLEEGMKKAHN